MATAVKTKSARKAPKSTAAGRKLFAAAQEIVYPLKTGDSSRLTTRTVEIPDPGEYGAAQVKALRDKLAVSQGIFATLIGVSSDLVAHWEHGIRTPGPLARRLMDLIAENPPAYLAKLIKRRENR